MQNARSSRQLLTSAAFCGEDPKAGHAQPAFMFCSSLAVARHPAGGNLSLDQKAAHRKPGGNRGPGRARLR